MSQQPGAVEACWANNPEVGESKPLAAMTGIFAPFDTKKAKRAIC